MLLLATVVPGAMFGIYQYVPHYAIVDATITFNGLERLSNNDARQFRALQNGALSTEAVRQEAVMLLDTEAAAKLGFLQSANDMHQTVLREAEVRWPSQQRNLMRLRVLSTDKQLDVARLRALATAVIRTNQAQTDQLANLTRDIQSRTGELSQLQAELAGVREKLLNVQQRGEQRPTPEQLATLETTRKTAEQMLRTARGNRQEIEASLDLARRPIDPENLIPDDAAPDATLPAPADEEVDKLTRQLADVQKQADAVKSAVVDRNNTARRELDQIITGLEQDLASAQRLKDSPALADYVASAQRHFAEAKKLFEDRMRRQEKLYQRLNELKQVMDATIDKQVKGKKSQDAELKRLNESLSMRTRQFNAATAEGLNDDAAKVAGEIQLTRSLIAAREEAFKPDPRDNEAPQRLQEIIDQTQRDILIDRDHNQEKLAELQESFAKSAPQVEKLPAEQKALAEAIEKKLNAVSEARKTYDATADASQADQEKLQAQLRDQTKALSTQISARNAIVTQTQAKERLARLEAARLARIDKLSAELKAVTTTEQSAQGAVDSAMAAIQTAQASQRAFVAGDEEARTLDYSREQIVRKIKETNGALDSTQRLRAILIVPEPRPEMQSYDNTEADQRPLFAGLGGGALLLTLLVPIIWNLLLISRDAHHGTVARPLLVDAHTSGHDTQFANGETHVLFDNDVGHDPAPENTANGHAFEPVMAQIEEEPADVDADRRT